MRNPSRILMYLVKMFLQHSYWRCERIKQLNFLLYLLLSSIIYFHFSSWFCVFYIRIPTFFCCYHCYDICVCVVLHLQYLWCCIPCFHYKALDKTEKYELLTIALDCNCRYFQGIPETVVETEQRGGCACWIQKPRDGNYNSHPFGSNSYTFLLALWSHN